jgi:hypothetical protein
MIRAVGTRAIRALVDVLEDAMIPCACNEENEQEESPMLLRMLAVGIAFIFIGASQPAASAQGDTGGIKGKGVKSTPTHALQTHGKSKVKNLRGKRNPSDQGREH